LENRIDPQKYTYQQSPSAAAHWQSTKQRWGAVFQEPRGIDDEPSFLAIFVASRSAVVGYINMEEPPVVLVDKMY
jgi:hypothetical protein